MSTAASVEPRIERVEVDDETITAHLLDGRVISVPIAWSWRLSDATPRQRANWKLIGDGHGVHWPEIDEDISADGMLTGVPARRPRRAVRPSKGKAGEELRSTSLAGRRKTKSKNRPGAARG